MGGPGSGAKKQDLATRFHAKTAAGVPSPHRPDLGPCTVWTGARDGDGYGSILVDGKPRGAHRIAWELARGPIPDGLTIDHLCRVVHCVHVAHMELVPMRVNILRSDNPCAQFARRTHCKHGHALTPDNIYRTKRAPHERRCRACTLAACKVRNARLAARRSGRDSLRKPSD